MSHIDFLIRKLQGFVYEYVCRSLFKADRLMFAMHFVHKLCPKLFNENEWEAFTGVFAQEGRDGGSIKLPSWIEQDRAQAVTLFSVHVNFSRKKNMDFIYLFWFFLYL